MAGETGTAASLLTYRTSTEPSPMQTSTPQVTARGRLNISAASTDPVYCDQVQVAVPVGTTATDMFALPPVGSVSTGKWALTTVLLKGRDLGLDNDQDYASFTYDCVSPSDYLVAYDLVFGIVGTVSVEPGDCSVLIQEHSGTASDPATFTYKTSTLTISTVSPRFYIDNFVATAPATPTVPSSEFTAGSRIDFSWESNGTYFRIFAKGATTPIYADTKTRFSLPAGVDRDTTFVLVASVTGNPGQDSGQGGYEPIYLYETLTITVSNPALTPSAVTVSGTLTVNGASTLSGDTTMNSATVNKNLAVNGLSTQSDIIAVDSLMALRAVVSMHRPGKLIYSGTDFSSPAIYATTDGFAVAQILSGSGLGCFAYASIYTDPSWFQIQGGTVTSGNLTSVNPNMMCLPIPANTYWYCVGQNATGGGAKTQIQIFWFPVGGAAAEESHRMLSEAETRALPAPPPPPPVAEPRRVTEARSAAANDFVTKLETVFGRTVPADSRTELADLLAKL